VLYSLTSDTVIFFGEQSKLSCNYAAFFVLVALSTILLNIIFSNTPQKISQEYTTGLSAWFYKSLSLAFYVDPLDK
jgi:hypothetical protein